ncbi:MAG: ATP-binding protein [Spirochaetales bacterium]|nr:ATP-binding protein [Spirochaetales bacterium]
MELEKNYYLKPMKSLLFTGYVLAFLCFILEVGMSPVVFPSAFKKATWVFRWIILPNVINGVIIIAGKILIRFFEGHVIKQCYVSAFSLLGICSVIACHHYYFVPVQWIFTVPILLTIQVMDKKLNVLVSVFSFAGLIMSFIFRYIDPTEIRNFFPDLVMGLIYVTILALTSFKLIAYLQNQNMELKKSKEDALKANSAKSDFLLNMSHEIRTPINSILGMNEMILRESKEDAICGYAENINSSGHTLLSLINDILDLSKIEAGKIEIIDNKYRIEDIVRETVLMINERIEKKNLEFEVDVDENLPSCLWGDASRIREIILNFLTNAAKYTREGKITYRVYGKKSDGSMEMNFSVKDTGPGIKEEDLKKMFGRFERFDIERNRNIEGSGIGLRISKQLALLMGGDIDVRSVYGQGSEFILVIKQKIIDSDRVGKVDYKKLIHHKEKKYEVLFKAPEAKILVVDDIELNLCVIENLLKQTEMKVCLAQSGDECIKISQKEKFDLILIDHMMPCMDGMETFKHVKNDEKSLNKETPCVMLTANAFNGAREIYEKAGFVDYITKPIDCEKLEGIVGNLLPAEKVKYNY